MAKVETALRESVRLVARQWKAAKRQADREDRVSRAALERMAVKPPRKLNLKEASYQVMEPAYLTASANGTLPANARQVMYAARPEVQQLAGKLWEHDSYFTQDLLPDYQTDYPERTRDWDVVYDARGHLVEPHTGAVVDLGTLKVRDYLRRWTAGPVSDTVGPAYRYGGVLFIEKEGFNPLLERAAIGARFDLAIMSTKGMSVTAARRLVEAFTEEDVTVYVLHDFDVSGFSILHTLRTDTRRYAFTADPLVVDLGLRLDDVYQLGLQSEAVEFDPRIKTDPRINLQRCGATDEECDFLVHDRDWGGYEGERVELNAMPSDVFITWLERKLQEAGVTKVLPDAEVLAQCYVEDLTTRLIEDRVQEAIREAEERAREEATAEVEAMALEAPADLREQLEARLEADGKLAWDAALTRLVRADAEARQPEETP